MPDEEPVSTKKCPHCQQWSAWHLQPTDRCEHCGQLLDPRAHSYAQQVAAEPSKPGIRLLEIGPDDKGLVRFLKLLVRGGQLLFIVIMGFYHLAGYCHCRVVLTPWPRCATRFSLGPCWPTAACS